MIFSCILCFLRTLWYPCSNKNVNFSGESSDEELGSVSPVDDLSARSGGETQTFLFPITISAPGEHSGASSSVSTTSSGVFPPSSLPGLQGRARVRSITPNRFTRRIFTNSVSFIRPCSETESGECSEGEMSDLTPCNASPSLSQLLSWTGCRCYNTQCSKMKAPRKLDSHNLQAFGEE